MGELEAHLDRGWDLVSRGNFAGAETSARQALGIDRDCADAWALLGVVEHGRNEPEAALEHFERALELDPEHIETLLCAAETCLSAGGDAKRAARLAAQAMDAAEDEEAFVDALVLKAEAELAQDDMDEARKTLSELPDADFEDVELHLAAGRLLTLVDELERGESELRKVLRREPDCADAWHAIGCAAEARGDEAAMVAAWRKVRELDLAEPRAPWALCDREFEAVAEKALAELPERARALLANVPIRVDEYPAPELLEQGYDPRLLGLFSGVPYPEQSSLDGTPHLECIFLYQRNLERQSPSGEVLRSEIRTTLIHETGHFFGLDDDDLDAMGLG